MPDPAGTASRDAMAPSRVYVLCLDPPRGIGEADVPRAAAISHYVGWTQQDWPMHRAGSPAGAGMGTCVLLIPGTLADEEELKTQGTCPRCGRSLNYPGGSRAAGLAAPPASFRVSLGIAAATGAVVRAGTAR
jgi:hypothetical protein